ncbi:MAG TPA: hypothetical protein VNS46_11595 [Nocardioides sp.]|nr:hypothetical protein [Nocardioides sp.]
MSTTTNGDALTQAQLLKFNSMWNDRDREHIAADVEALGGVSFTYADSGWNRSVVVRDADGTEVMAVAPGLIYYGAGITRPGSEHMESHGGHVWRTSRNGKGSGQSKTAPDPTGRNAMCDVCFLHHPAGECDR